MENDLSLLRPFSLKAVSAGDPIVLLQDGKAEPREFITGPDGHGYFVVKTPDNWFRFGKVSEYRMAPLCWVEGKPVYKGDVLYCPGDKKLIAYKVRGYSSTYGLVFDGYDDDCGCFPEKTKFTWNPPTVKREGWVNVSKGPLGPVIDMLYDSQERADEFAPSSRIATVRIEWEEPAC